MKTALLQGCHQLCSTRNLTSAPWLQDTVKIAVLKTVLWDKRNQEIIRKKIHGFLRRHCGPHAKRAEEQGVDGERPHRFTAFGSAACADSVTEHCLPTSMGIPSGRDKNVAQLGWQTKNNMGCSAREPEPAGRVLSDALLIPGSTGASSAAGTNPNRKLATHKQSVLK